MQESSLRRAVQGFLYGTDGLENIMGAMLGEESRILQYLFEQEWNRRFESNPDVDMNALDRTVEDSCDTFQEACHASWRVLTRPARYDTDATLRAAAEFAGRYINTGLEALRADAAPDSHPAMTIDEMVGYFQVSQAGQKAAEITDGDEFAYADDELDAVSDPFITRLAPPYCPTPLEGRDLLAAISRMEGLQAHYQRTIGAALAGNSV